MPTSKPEDRREPSAVVQARDFPGLVLNADPHDLPPGAAVSGFNATPVVPGQLTVRRGTRVVQFDT